MRNRFDSDWLTQANKHIAIFVHHVIHLDLKAVVEVRRRRERVAEVLKELIPLIRDSARSHAVVDPGGHDHPSTFRAPSVEAWVMFRLNHAVMLELGIQIFVPNMG